MVPTRHSKTVRESQWVKKHVLTTDIFPEQPNLWVREKAGATHYSFFRVQSVPPETKIPFLGWFSHRTGTVGGSFIFSNSCRHRNHLVFKALRTQMAWPSLTVSDSAGLEWGPRICLSSKFPGNVYAAGQGSSL